MADLLKPHFIETMINGMRYRAEACLVIAYARTDEGQGSITIESTETTFLTHFLVRSPKGNYFAHSESSRGPFTVHQLTLQQAIALYQQINNRLVTDELRELGIYYEAKILVSFADAFPGVEDI